MRWFVDRERVAFAAIVMAGAALRVWAARWDPPLHPDEYFQYLEPAWWHWTGAGSETWEWRDGIRSWVLPFYHGAWIAFLSFCGLDRGPALEGCIRVHWALVNTGVVWIAYRGGFAVSMGLAQRATAGTANDELAAGRLGGLIAAGLCAGLAPLVLYASHTLSEMPSMLCLLAGLVLAGEVTGSSNELARQAPMHKAALVGVLLSVGACLRIANGPLVLIPLCWLLVARRYRALATTLAAAGCVAIGFALVDLATWGGFGSSFIAYLRFNLVEGNAARFGTKSADWYLHVLSSHAPFGFPMVTLVAAAGLRVTWPYLSSALLALAYLSLQPHKEARFIIGVWPLLLIAASGTLGALLQRFSSTPHALLPRVLRFRWPHLAAVAFAVFILCDAARDSTDDWLDNERLEAIAWVGSRPNLTGLMIDDVYAVSGVNYGSRAPKLQYAQALLGNPMISHLLVPAASELRRQGERAGFAVIRAGVRYAVLYRAPQREARSDSDR